MKTRMVVTMRLEGRQWEISSLLLASNAVLLSQSQTQFQRLLRYFEKVCKRSSLSVNVYKSKVMAYEKNTNAQCGIAMNEQVMKNIRDFKYRGGILITYGSLIGELQERVKQGRITSGVLKNISKKQDCKSRDEKDLHNSVLLPVMFLGSQTWTLLEGRG